MKQLTLKSIDNIKLIYEHIKKLDEEILQIDKLGMLIAEQDSVIDFKISTPDLAAAEKDKKKVKFDEDGSIVNSDRVTSGWVLPSINEWVEDQMRYIKAASDMVDKQSAPCFCVSGAISQKTALLVLGVVLNEKREEREAELRKLESYGFRV